MIALWSYQSTSNDELSFSENEIITILNKDDPNWYKGKSNATGKVGLFPSSYTEDVRVAKSLLEGNNPPGYQEKIWNAPVARFSSGPSSSSEYGNHQGINPNAPVPQTEEQKMKQDRVSPIDSARKPREMKVLKAFT